MKSAHLALLLVVACSPEPGPGTSVVHTDGDTPEQPDSEAAVDSEGPVSTDPPTDTLPVVESDSLWVSPDSDAPLDTERIDSEPIEDSPTDTDVNAESRADTESAVEAPPESAAESDGPALYDSDTSRLDAPEESDRTNHSDLLQDSEPNSDSETALSDSEPDSPVHTDLPYESDIDSNVDDTLASHTDTARSDTDQPPATWPIAPRCTFRTDGVYAPTNEWRSIDFDNQAGNYLLLANLFAPLDNSGVNKMIMTLGDSTSRLWAGFFDTPGPGISPYQDVMSASIQTPGVQYPIGALTRGPLDFDADGTYDISYYSQSPGNACMALTGLAGQRAISSWDSNFFDSDVLGTLYMCQPEDINGDGQSDLHMVYRFSNGASETRWYLGPFNRGDLDLAGTVHMSLPLPGPRGGFHAPGDYNGDGFVDLALAWWGADLTDGEILIWFGPLGGDLDPNLPDTRIESTAGSGYFANHLVINAGDIDGDGTDDLAFKSTEHRDGHPFANAVYVFKGPLHPGPGLLDDDADSIITWPATMARTGNFIIPLGDVDGDERDDFAVNVWAGRHRPPPGFPLRPIWPPELVPPEGSDSAAPIDTDVAEPDTEDSFVAPLDSWDTSAPSGPPPTYNPFPWGRAQGAIMVFGDTPPGEIGPQQAKFTLAGTRPGDWIGHVGMIGPGDLNGDGLADLAYSADPYGTGVRVRVVFPCTDFGEPALP